MVSFVPMFPIVSDSLTRLRQGQRRISRQDFSMGSQRSILSLGPVAHGKAMAGSGGKGSRDPLPQIGAAILNMPVFDLSD